MGKCKQFSVFRLFSTFETGYDLSESEPKAATVRKPKKDRLEVIFQAAACRNRSA
jgi:hypothetical protein